MLGLCRIRWSFSPVVPTTIAVGAINTGVTTRAPFSNNNAYVDVAAPGTGIDSTIPTGILYGQKSGTSMATPFVSATAALILRDCPLMLDAVRTKIQSSGTVAATGFAEPEVLVDAAAAATGC